MLWMGFAVAASIAIINGLSFLFPAIPTIPVKRAGSWHGIGHLFTEKPWNAIGHISFSFYPFVIGLGFLMPLDLAFSSWLLLSILQGGNLILTSALGINIPGFPYHNEQCFGAAVGICLTLLIYSRKYVFGVFKAAFKNSPMDDEDEPVGYRFCHSRHHSGIRVSRHVFSKDWDVSLAHSHILWHLLCHITRDNQNARRVGIPCSRHGKYADLRHLNRFYRDANSRDKQSRSAITLQVVQQKLYQQFDAASDGGV